MGNTHGKTAANHSELGKSMRYFSANCNLDPLELEFWKDSWTRESPHQGQTCPNQNFQKSIFKPATAISFREEMRASTPKFSAFFSRSFFGFLISKMSFIGQYKGKNAIYEIEKFLPGDL